MLSAGAFGLIRAEAALARRAIGEPTGVPPDADGVYGGAPHAASRLRMVMLGDSSACGLGVDHPHQTPGAMLAAGLAECADRPVELVAGGGGRCAQQRPVRPGRAGRRQPARTSPSIMIGANDVTHRVRPPTAVRHLDHAVRRLRELGAEVVVGTCPDLGTVEPVPQPLRWIARRASRQLAAAQTIAVVEAGGRTVSLGDILGPGVRGLAVGDVRAGPVPPVGGRLRQRRGRDAALGLRRAGRLVRRRGGGRHPDLARGEGVRPISLAAVEAADEPGTEVAGAQVGGRDRGPRGRWALLRRRASPTEPDADEMQATAEEDAPLR